MTERKSQSEREYLGVGHLQGLYDLVHLVSGLGRIHREMVTLADVRAGQRVLDVGCGTGNLLRSTAKAVRGAELVGIDPDPKMIAKATRKLRGAARLERGFAQEIPHADGSFDAVFSSMMLHHLDDAGQEEMLAEVLRVLRPGGVFVLADGIFDRPHEHGHGHMHGLAGGVAAKKLAAAGFDVEPTRVRKLRIGPRLGVEVARKAVRPSS